MPSSELLDSQLVDAVAAAQPEPGAWVHADAIARRLAEQGRPAPSALSIGRRLSRLSLAKHGGQYVPLERQWSDGWACWSYRPRGAG